MFIAKEEADRKATPHTAGRVFSQRHVLVILWVLFACGSAQYEDCEANGGYVYSIGNGRCNSFNNIYECGYDGGDCCLCTETCTSGSNYEYCYLSTLFCADPDANCTDPLVAMYPNCTGYLGYYMDGYCHAFNNNEECGYDGGDCCECTINSTLIDQYDSVDLDFSCLDPNSGCVDERVAAFPNCTGYVFTMTDGYCDDDNNNEECGFDGGDCCVCSCVDNLEYSCVPDDVSCLDPNSHSVLYNCEARPSTAPSCPTGYQHSLVVEDTAQARALAEAINCSGGTFHVEWRGDVVLDTTIVIEGGTVLNVTGVGTDASASGAGTTRLLTVVDSFLYVSDLVFRNGSAIVGGAIAAASSTLEFTQCTFDGNMASRSGGSLFVNSSNVHFQGETRFSNNTAQSGGALFIVSDSNVSWSGRTTFSSNIAHVNIALDGSWDDFDFMYGKGGGLYAASGSSLSWTGETMFLNNSAIDGGALRLDYSSATWSGYAMFSGNLASGNGGSIFVRNSTGLCNGTSIFDANEAGSTGGAVFVWDDARMDWTGRTTFVQNAAQSSRGGAVAVISHASTSWTGRTTFSGNTALDWDGGALIVWIGSHASWNGETLFENNLAYDGGGAMTVQDSSSVSFKGNTTFSKNAAVYIGTNYVSPAGYGAGIIISYNSTATWEGKTTFLENVAERGGGVYVEVYSIVSWIGEVHFSHNYVTKDGGALCIVEGSNASWDGQAHFFNNTAETGGALFLTDGSTVQWRGETNFTANHAVLNGGAIGSEPFNGAPPDTEHVINNEESTILIYGATTFVNNSCGDNGGALAMLGILFVAFETKDVAFVGNIAGVRGGAVFISSTGIGPIINNVHFYHNKAQLGGGISVMGSGITITYEGDEEVPHPTTIDDCSFVGNFAEQAGGAVESLSGKDIFTSTSFVLNSASVGGALRLTGTSSIDNCQFVDNLSSNGGGPAVSNIGFMSNVVNSYFVGNVFNCARGMFLGFNKVSSEDTLEIQGQTPAMAPRFISENLRRV